MTSRARKTETASQSVEFVSVPEKSLKAVEPQAKPLTQAEGKNVAADTPVVGENAGKKASLEGSAKRVVAAKTIGKLAGVKSSATEAAGTGAVTADGAKQVPNPAPGAATPLKAAFTRNAAAFVAARQKMTPGVQVAPSTSKDHVMEDSAQVADKQASDKKPARKVEAAAPSAGHPLVRPAPGPTEAPQPAVTVPSVPPKAVAKVAVATKQPFKTLEFVVYPAHGVGQIVAIEEQVVAGYKLELFVISFIKDKMILKVPLPKIASVGMRKLAEAPIVKRALDTLMGRARVKRTMWSRRAQEYEAKINSGDLVAIAEVVRDLYRSDAQPEQSYSERQLYEAALDRMAREIAAVQNLSDSEALKVIDGQLQKGPRRSKADEVEDADEAEGGESDGGIVEAA